MFTLAFERTHRVLLARFAGIISSEDIEALDRAAIGFVAREGSVRGLLDFSGVEAVAAPQTFFAARERPLQFALGQERVIVAPHLQAYELARAFASQQRDFDNIEPRVVPSLWDAYRLLSLDRPNFQSAQ